MNQDPFAYIGDQESEQIRQAERAMALAEGRIRLCKAIQAIKSSPGWNEYCEAVADVADAMNTKLLDEKETRRDYLAGFCSGVGLLPKVVSRVDAELRRCEQVLAGLKKQAEGWQNGRIRNVNPI